MVTFQNGGRGVGGVSPDRRIESDGQIADGPRQRPPDILRMREWNDAVDARQSLGGPKADEVVLRRRNPDRADPPGFRVRSYGFSVCPPIDEIVVMPDASSCMFALPMTTAPASRSFAT